MILLALIVLVIAVGLLRGFKEGMIHIMPFDAQYVDLFACGGVRCHRWHPYYHVIGLSKMALFAVMCIVLWGIRPSWIFISALLILLWETFEIGYSYSRHNKITCDTELIVFVDILKYRLRGWKVWAIHGLRIIFSLLFLYIGF